jgi:hypothetical protein
MNGALKPDVIAPVYGLSGLPCSFDRGSSQTILALPSCTQLSGGTSAAGPRAASVVAVLLSGLRQARMRQPDPPELYSILRQTARFIPGAEAYEQGFGLIDAMAAWEALGRPRQPLPVIEIGFPSNGLPSASGAILRRGIFEQVPWRENLADEYDVSLTRIRGTGPASAFRLRWRGNDGSFASPSSVRLPIGEARSVPILARLRAPGFHSAILEVRDGRDRLVQAVAVNVVAGRPIRAGSAVAARVVVPWPDPHADWLFVPPGLARLQIRFAVEEGVAGLQLQPPISIHQDLRPVASTYVRRGAQGEITVEQPVPGVWGLVFRQCEEPSRPRPPSPCSIGSAAADHRMARLHYVVEGR